MITIRHTHEDGTLVYGTVKGDGVYEIIGPRTEHRFRWFRSIGMIGIPQSRDRVADRWRINRAADALRAAGFEVKVEIDDQHRDRAEVIADQAERLDDRREALRAKTARHQAASDAAYERADEIAKRRPFGQPILVGHHSERSARADQRRIERAMDTFCEEAAKAREYDRRARAVGNDAKCRATPRATARRLKTAEAELRKITKYLDGYTTRHLSSDGKTPLYVFDHKPAEGDWREQLLARKTQLEDQLRHDREQLSAAVQAGAYIEYGPHNVHVGDLVRRGWARGVVVRVNRVTVKIRVSDTWTPKVPFTDLTEVECPH